MPSYSCNPKTILSTQAALTIAALTHILLSRAMGTTAPEGNLG